MLEKAAAAVERLVRPLAALVRPRFVVGQAELAGHYGGVGGQNYSAEGPKSVVAYWHARHDAGRGLTKELEALPKFQV